MKKILPYSRQWIREKDIRTVVKALRDDFITTGWHIEHFEEKLREYTGAKYAVVVSSASAGLHIAMLAAGIKPGDEGITTPNTFLASANSICYAGAKPVFADIDPETKNISPAQIERRITRKTKVIVPVHYAGHPCDMDAIHAIAKKRKLIIIEDAAHAVGGSYRGKKIGALTRSDMCVFSFHAVKNMTAGEGGAVVTNNEEWYHVLRELRSHGLTRDKARMEKHEGRWWYEQHRLGFNYRITDYQAMLLASQLSDLDSFIRRKRSIVKRYDEAFDGTPHVRIPVEKEYAFSPYHLYALEIDFNALGVSREAFMDALSKEGIGSQVLYIPVHTQPYYRKNFGYKQGDYPAAEDHYQRNLAIPLYAKLSDADVQRVIRAFTKVCRMFKG
ncbi:MAG: UDP-4-amino-4,6-dideoxy-N-acetyl-beta-L-altrosamine transaminase [Spirochaetota bacterium]